MGHLKSGLQIFLKIYESTFTFAPVLYFLLIKKG